jgi:hypothetical protein
MLEKFAKDTVGMAERRNRIVHDPWNLNMSTSPRRFEITARKVLRYMFVEVTTDEVRRCANDIRNLVDRFEKLHEQVIAEFHELYTSP